MCHSSRSGVGITYIVMAYAVMAWIVMAYAVVAWIVMAYTVMAWIVKADMPLLEMWHRYHLDSYGL